MNQQILSITQLNEYIRGKLDNDVLLNSIAVRGEISNYKVYPSGHHYFTLKDEAASLKCVMFKGNAIRLRFRPGNGVKVIAMGKISVKVTNYCKFHPMLRRCRYSCAHRLRRGSCKHRQAGS